MKIGVLNLFRIYNFEIRVYCFMKISVSQYAKSLYEATKEKSQSEIDVIAINFANLLKKNNQSKLIRKVIERFCEIYNKENGIIEAEVITKSEMSQSTSDKIEKFIQEKYAAKKVVLRNVMDKKIKGGIIIKIGDDLLDASVSRKLMELKNKLTS